MQRIAPPPRKEMIYWLGEACKEAREQSDLLQVHIAASISRNQSTVTRFEGHEGQPRDIDEMVAAYANDLGLTPQELWARALKLWIANSESDAATAGQVEREVAGAVERSRSSRRPRARGAGEPRERKKARGA